MPMLWNKSPAFTAASPCFHRKGFTLVELLVASTLGLMAMAAVASLFGVYGRTVSQSQALIDLGSRLRSVAWQLRQDLDGLTAPAKPWVRAEANAGYLEIVEGPLATSTAVLGDVDDRLMLTTSSPVKPFTGRVDGIQQFESPVAEVAWFCEPSGQSFDGVPLHNLYRRQLLVCATPAAGIFNNTVYATIDRNANDLSCRTIGTTQTPNALSDLSKPANRFWTVIGTVKTLTGTRQGEDLIASNVISFDIRICPSGATAYSHGSYNTNYADGGTPTAGPDLAGVEVRLRCVEPSSKQIRQVTVVHSFDTR